MTGSKIKACIIQCEAVHEEITPSIVKCLNDNDIPVDVYLNENILKRRGDIYKEIKGLNLNVIYTKFDGAKSWRILRENCNKVCYDLVIFSTYQFKSIIDYSSGFNSAVFGVVHNIKIFEESYIECKKNELDNILGLIVLADHVKTNLAKILIKYKNLPQLDSLITIYPHYWQNPEQLYFRREIDWNSKKLKIIVPGSVNFANRNFKEIIECIKNNPIIKEKLEIVIAGGGKNRQDLENEIQKLNLSNSFKFLKLNHLGWVEYPQYYEEISQSFACLPLSANKLYKTEKITSAIPTSIGFLIPAILPISQKDQYKIPSYSYSSSTNLNEFLNYLITKEKNYKNSDMFDKLYDHLNKNILENKNVFYKLLKNIKLQ